MNLSWNRISYLFIVLSGIIVLSYYLFQSKSRNVYPPIEQYHSITADSIPTKKTQAQVDQSNSINKEIPADVLRILNHILKYQEAPPNYVGGRIFQNREKKLNTVDGIGNKITYKEWDVHPKVKGQNRGAERLITGSDHSAYYTLDHYQTFIKIKP